MSAALDHFLSVLIFSFFVAAPLPLAATVLAWRERELGARVSLPQALLIVLAVWCVVQALVAQLLGLLRVFRFPGMMAAEVFVLALGLWLLRRHSVPPWNERWGRLARADALATIVLLGLSYMGLTLVWWSAAIPVVNWDSWAYHMPHMADWQRTGWFTRMVQGVGRPRNSYPYGWEALCTLFMAPFGEDLFVTFPNVVAWVVLGLATYLLARMFRAQSLHALAAVALLLSIHYVADAVNTMHIDMPFAALFMASAYYGAVAVRSGSRVAFSLCAATIGLACATRITGPVYAILLAGWLVLVRIRTNDPLRVPQSAPRAIAVIGCIAGLALGSFWYLKNLVEIGRLIGGSANRLASRDFISTKTLIFTFNPVALADWKALYDRAFHELDAPFVALVAMTAIWPLAVRHQGQRRARPSAMELLALLLASGFVFVCTPTSAISGAQIRLGLVFLAMLAVSAAVGATRAGLHPAIPAAFVVLSISRTFDYSRMLYALMLLGVAWGVWHGRARLLHLTRPQAAALLIPALIVMTAAARGRREGERIKTYGSHYAYLEQHLDPAEPVAYLMSFRPYQFYGRRLQREVVYAPFAPEQSPSDWAESVRRQGIRFVVMGPDIDREGAASLLAAGSPLQARVGDGTPGQISVFELTARPSVAPQR